MIVDQEKYQYLRGCIGAMDNMKKTISSLKKEIKEKQSACHHSLLLITECKENEEGTLYTLVCPKCLSKKKVSNLDEKYHYIDASSYPYINDFTENERIFDIVDLFYNNLSDETLDLEELSEKMNNKIVKRRKMMNYHSR